MDPKFEQPKTEKQARLAELWNNLRLAEAFGQRSEIDRIKAEIERAGKETETGVGDEEIFQVGLERIFKVATTLGESSEFGRGVLREYFELSSEKEKFPRFIALLEAKFGKSVSVPRDLAHQSKSEFGIGGDIYKDVPSGRLIFVGDSGIVLEIVNEPERKEKGLIVERETMGIRVCKIPPEFVSKLKSLAK